MTDLLVARQSKSGNNLRELIDISSQVYEFLLEENNIDPEFVLRTMCVIRGEEIKKANILRLDAKNFQKDWTLACESLDEAYRLVTNLQTGFGAIDLRRFMPFRTMLVPLACLLFQIKNEEFSNSKSCYDKISEWYWASVFGNRYNEAVNTISFSDIQRVNAWMHDDEKVPEFIREFSSMRIDFAVTSKASSTYRGILCCILKRGALDFRSGKDPTQEIKKLQDDHIFPRVGFSDNSILNRTLISTNAEKSNQLPGRYFSALETVHGRDELSRILETHLIDANCLQYLLANDLQNFKKVRTSLFQAVIQSLVAHSSINTEV